MMYDRIEEPVERLRECSTFEEASTLARKTSTFKGMLTAVRASENGWEVLVPPGAAYILNHPEVPETEAARHARAVLDEVRIEVMDEQSSLSRSEQTGWFYRD